MEHFQGQKLLTLRTFLSLMTRFYQPFEHLSQHQKRMDRQLLRKWSSRPFEAQEAILRLELAKQENVSINIFNNPNG